MTIERMYWVGDRLHIQHHIEDVQSIRETIILYPDEAYDIYFWFSRPENKRRLLDACARQLKEQVEKEGA